MGKTTLMAERIQELAECGNAGMRECGYPNDSKDRQMGTGTGRTKIPAAIPLEYSSVNGLPSWPHRPTERSQEHHFCR